MLFGYLFFHCITKVVFCKGKIPNGQQKNSTRLHSYIKSLKKLRKILDKRE